MCLDRKEIVIAIIISNNNNIIARHLHFFTFTCVFTCREIVDSKCYSLSYEFLCQLLQPVCFQEKMVLPCRDFCSEFMQSCAHVLPVELRDRIECQVLATEADGPGACISKPG